MLELENALHKLVQDRTINLVNLRKEFYRDVDLDEVEIFVKKKRLERSIHKVSRSKRVSTKHGNYFAAS
jgi:hypothetical protein